MKTFNFFEKLWEHGRTLRRVGLVLVMCLITITQSYAGDWFTDGMWQVYGWDGSSNDWHWTGIGKNNDCELGVMTSSRSITIKGVGANTNQDSGGDVKWVGVHCFYLDNTDAWLDLIYRGKTGNNKYWDSEMLWDLSIDKTVTPGNYYFGMDFWMNDGGDNYNKNYRKIKWTIPGFVDAPASKSFGTAPTNSEAETTISFTHYGNALTTGNCSITGTNQTEFEVRSISESGVTVVFKPSSNGSKSATLTINDGTGLNYSSVSISLSGTAGTSGTVTRLYFNDYQYSGAGNWAAASAKYRFTCTYTSGVVTRYNMTKCDNTEHTYYADVDVRSGYNVSIDRYNPSSPYVTWNTATPTSPILSSSNPYAKSTDINGAYASNHPYNDVTGGMFYYDNSESGFENYLYLLVGHDYAIASGSADTYSDKYTLSNISNTKLYYNNASKSWHDATYYAVIGNTSSSPSWGTNWGSSTIPTKGGKGYTAAYTSLFGLLSGSTYLASSPSKTGGTMTINKIDGLPNCSITIAAKVKPVGGAYTAGASKGALSGSAKRFSDATSCGTGTSATVSVGSTSSVLVAGYTCTKCTLSVSSVANGYTFRGWYNASGTKLSDNTSYTGYLPKGDATVYAYFEENSYTITYNNMTDATNHGSNPSSYSVTSSTITLQKPTKDGYVFEGWYAEANLYNRVTTIPNGSTGDKVLYAAWLPLHEPGVYVSSSAGGYNRSLTTYEGEKYEVYASAKSTSTYIYAGSTSTTSTSDVYCMGNFSNETLTLGKWINAFITSNSNGTFSASAEHPACTNKMLFKNNSSKIGHIEFCVNGYTSLAIQAKDGGSKKSDNSYLKVIINGTDVASFSSSVSVRRYDLTGYTSPITIRLEGQSSTASELYSISLKPAAPSISASSLSGATYDVGASADALSVTASPVVAGATLNYQWYSNTTNAATVDNEHKITGATSYSYTPPTTSAGTTYYYCVVSETGCNSTTSSVSGAIVVNAAACGATAPGSISKGSLSGCSITLTASGSAASNNTWYWQNSDDGESTSESGATKTVDEAGTYYLRSYYSTGNCWSDAVSFEVTDSHLTPAAPTGFSAGSITHEGATFSITDAGNASSYDIYYSKYSTAPVSGTSATTTSTSKSKAIIGLDAGTAYYAWARSVCGSNKSSWVALNPGSDSHTFTTVATHSVTVNYNGSDAYGTASAGSSTVAEGNTTTITASPATGYQVTNWAVSGTGSTISPSGASNSNTTTLTMGTADATVTCTFGAKTYSITLDKNGGTSSNGTATATYDSDELTSITAPTYTDHTLDGYYTSSNCTTQVATDAGALQASITVSEVAWTNSSSEWKKDGDATFYAHYKCNTPVITCTSNVVTITVPTGSTVYYTTTTNGDTPSDPTSGSTAYNPSSKPTISADTKIKAIAIQDGCTSSDIASADLEYSPTLYTVTYNANGGSCATGSATQESEGGSLELPTPTWSGYTFEGWYNSGTKAGDAGASYTPGSDITLYAHWTDNISGKIFSYIDGLYGDKYKAFDLSDWVTSGATGKDKTYTNGTTGVQFVVDDGAWDSKSNSISSLAKFKNGDTDMSIVIPTGKIATVKIGYGAFYDNEKKKNYGPLTIEGSTQTGVSTVLTDEMTNAQVDGALKEITLSSQQGTLTLGSALGNVYIGRVSATITGYVVTYAKGSADGANGDSFTGTKTAGSSFTLSSSSSAFTRDGYTYDGWSINANGSTKDYNLGGSYTTDAAITLYPHWVSSAYAITNADPDNGTIAITDGSSAITESEAGETVYISATPSTGYHFTSWDVYQTGSSSTKVDLDNDDDEDGKTRSFTMPSYAVTVDAAFAINSWTLSWDFDDGSSSETAGTDYTSGSTNYGVTIDYPGDKTMSKEGYTFTGWDSSAETMPDNDLKITALWSANTYDVASHTLSNVTLTDGGATGSDKATHDTNYTATFAANTGYNLPSDVTVEIGDVTMTKDTHYTWNSTTGELSINGSYILGNIAISVTSVAKTYTLTLDKNGGSADGSATITWGERSITFDPEATAPNASYHLYGYYTEAEGGTQIITSINNLTGDYVEGWTTNALNPTWAHDANETLYARWWRVVLLNENSDYHGSTYGSAHAILGGSALESITHAVGESGYTLQGYYTDKLGGTKVLNANGTYADEDIDGFVEDGKWINETSGTLSLYAHWAKECTVTYDGNSEDDGDAPDAVDALYGTTITVASNSGSLTKTGYSFVGWNTANDGSGTFYAVGSTFTVIGDITLYAQWASCGSGSTVYVIGYTNSDGTSQSSSASNRALSVSNTWYTSTSPTYTDKTSTDGFTITASQATYYWCQGSTSFNSSSTGATMKCLKLTSEKPITIKWTNSSLSFSKVKIIGLNAAADDPTTYSVSNGTSSESFTFAKGNSTPQTKEISMSFTYGNSNGVTISGSGPKEIRCLIELSNSGCSTYNVSFANMTGFAGETTLPSTITGVPSGAKIAEPVSPKADGYAFAGWYKEGACSNKWDFSTDVVSSAKTLYAKWIDIDDTYTFHMGDGDIDNDSWKVATFTPTGVSNYQAITNFEIPNQDRYPSFFVGYEGEFVEDELYVDEGYSKMREWDGYYNMTTYQSGYIKIQGNASPISDGDTKTAEGAIGTLQMSSTTHSENWGLTFIPKGFGLTIAYTEDATPKTLVIPFHQTDNPNIWETESFTEEKSNTLTSNQLAGTFKIGLATKTDNVYVDCYQSAAEAASTINGRKLDAAYGGANIAAGASGRFQIILSSNTSTPNFGLRWVPLENHTKQYGSWDGMGNPQNKWSLGHAPTIDETVYVEHNTTITNDAQANKILINKGESAYMDLTIASNGSLLVAQDILAKTDEDGDYRATTKWDLRINTDYIYNGALITGAKSTTTQASYLFCTKAYKAGNYGYINQFIGIPFTEMSAYQLYGCLLYQYNAKQDKWLTCSTTMVADSAYNILRRATDGRAEFLIDGTLILPGIEEGDRRKVLTCNGGRYADAESWEGEHLFANSWAAPIEVGAMDVDDDFDGVDPTIYIFNAGSVKSASDKDKSDYELGNNPGQWTPLPVSDVKENPGDYPYKVIPAGQAFSVRATALNGTVTLDYYNHVYKPIMDNRGVVDHTSLRAPKQNTNPSTRLWMVVAGESLYKDETQIHERADFSTGHDAGWDGYKIFGNAHSPQLYTMSENSQLSVNAIPDMEGTVVGFRKGSDDDIYTFSFKYNGDDTWYLNDLKEQTSTLISNENTYIFSSESGDAEARFIISASPIAPVITGVEQTSSKQDAKARKVMINDHIYIIRGGRMYSIDGAVVK